MGKWYAELENKFQDIRCDEYILMPNHCHAIMANTGEAPVGADLCVCPDAHRNERTSGEHTGSSLLLNPDFVNSIGFNIHKFRYIGSIFRVAKA
jgi:hypothetical protein